MTTQQTPPGPNWRGSESSMDSRPIVPPRLVVDGSRPSVEWVSSLPASWTTQRERLVLFVLACDAFDNVASPGGAALAAWCGLINGRLYEALGALSRTTEQRPALVQRVDKGGHPIPEGKRYGGRARTGYRLRTELAPTLPTGRESDQLSPATGRVTPDNSPAELSPLTLPANSPAQPGDTLPFPTSISSPQVTTEPAGDEDEARKLIADLKATRAAEGRRRRPTEAATEAQIEAERARQLAALEARIIP